MTGNRVLLGGLVVALASAPLLVGEYHRYVVVLWMIYAISAIGLQIPLGLASVYSFGQGAFMLIGAYVTGLGVIHGVPVALALLAGALLAAVVGVVLALPSLRLSAFALAIVTLGAASVLFYGVKAFSFTGGPQGLFVPHVPFVQLAGGRAFYLCVLALLVAGSVVAHCVDRGPIGRSLRAAAANPLMAQSFGVHLMKTRTLAIVLSAIYGAVAGGMLGLLTGYIAPEAFAPELSIQIFAAVMIGGSGRYWGAILGALFIVLIPELTQSVQNLGAIVYAILFILVATLYPGGLYQLATTAFRRRTAAGSP